MSECIYCNRYTRYRWSLPLDRKSLSPVCRACWPTARRDGLQYAEPRAVCWDGNHIYAEEISEVCDSHRHAMEWLKYIAASYDNFLCGRLLKPNAIHPRRPLTAQAYFLVTDMRPMIHRELLPIGTGTLRALPINFIWRLRREYPVVPDAWWMPDGIEKQERRC